MVGKPHAVVIISSPGFKRFSLRREEVNADTTRRFAEEPEFVSRQCLTPKNLLNSLSNFDAYLPAVSQKSREESGG